MEKIAVDAMGGDFAPLEIVLGSIQAVREFKIPVVLVGDKEQILTILKIEIDFNIIRCYNLDTLGEGVEAGDCCQECRPNI